MEAEESSDIVKVGFDPDFAGRAGDMGGVLLAEDFGEIGYGCGSDVGLS